MRVARARAHTRNTTNAANTRARQHSLAQATTCRASEQYCNVTIRAIRHRRAPHPTDVCLLPSALAHHRVASPPRVDGTKPDSTRPPSLRAPINGRGYRVVGRVQQMRSSETGPSEPTECRIARSGARGRYISRKKKTKKKTILYGIGAGLSTVSKKYVKSN